MSFKFKENITNSICGCWVRQKSWRSLGTTTLSNSYDWPCDDLTVTVTPHVLSYALGAGYLVCTMPVLWIVARHSSDSGLWRQRNSVGIMATNNCVRIEFLGWSPDVTENLPWRVKSRLTFRVVVGLGSEADFVTQSQGKGLAAKIWIFRWVSDWSLK